MDSLRMVGCRWPERGEKKLNWDIFGQNKGIAGILLGVGGINHYPQILQGPILYEMICGIDLKTEKNLWLYLFVRACTPPKHEFGVQTLRN